MTFWEAIKNQLAPFGDEGAEIPKQMGGFFRAILTDQGVMVSNLGGQPFLPMEVFEAVEELLTNNPTHQAARGNAINFRLGDPGLPLNSVEGYIAKEVYKKFSGQTVFRRITPVACLLVWAGACRHGEKILIKN